LVINGQAPKSNNNHKFDSKANHKSKTKYSSTSKHINDHKGEHLNNNKSKHKDRGSHLAQAIITYNKSIWQALAIIGLK
jgi:hypothetical protein